jgi:peptidoglycan L-alanyl-D-glutamate endopeptidase CwlK
MWKLGNRSLTNLYGVDERLVKMCHEAIKIVDFAVIEGVRTQETQDRYYFEGKTKLKFPNSKHNKTPSLAIDIVPYPVDWSDKQRFAYLAGVFQGIAHNLGFKVRWGGDWNSDGHFKNETFHDLPHFEIVD